MMAILELDNVTKHFGGIIACQNISFSLREGKLLGLIGPNGAGKTTVFNLITGVYPLTDGAIKLAGTPIHNKRPDQIVGFGIARTFQNIRLFKNLSVLENVCIAVDRKTSYSLASALLRFPYISKIEAATKDKAYYYLEEVGLADKAQSRADSLPYGLQRKLEIARALALEPKVLLLDEPAAGMNPEESLELASLVRCIHKRFALATILIEHHMDVVMELCDTIVVLNFGEKLAEGTPAIIQSDPLVLRAYLGEEYKHAGS